MKIRMLRTLRHAGQPCWPPFSAGETYPATEAANMPPRPDGKRQVFVEQDNGPEMLCTIGEDCAEV